MPLPAQWFILVFSSTLSPICVQNIAKKQIPENHFSEVSPTRVKTIEIQRGPGRGRGIIGED